MRERDGERGAMIAEMAIVMPVLLIVVLGLFDVGRAVWTKHTLTHIAREAVRYASVRSESSDDPATVDKIRARTISAAVGINTKLLEIEPSWGPSNHTGSVVRVHVAYPFAPAVPLLPFDSIMLTSDSERVILY
jgi:Flp pilus assembly protein TadG